MQETIQKDSLIGKRITKLDAPEKAGGKTRYIQDLDLQGQLYGKILRSARVHAKIKSIDTSAAKALSGVHAVITAADVPWQRPIGVAKDHFPLKTDRVRSLRDEIAAVAARAVQQSDVRQSVAVQVAADGGGQTTGTRAGLLMPAAHPPHIRRRPADVADGPLELRMLRDALRLAQNGIA